jgi:hypothetical protein
MELSLLARQLSISPLDSQANKEISERCITYVAFQSNSEIMKQSINQIFRLLSN